MPQDPDQRMTPALRGFLKARDYLTFDLIGGPRLPLNIIINLQKGGTLPAVLGMMYYFDNWTPTAWAYLALHGSYGLCWLLKEAVAPDPAWQRPATLFGHLAAWASVLGPYWIAPYLMCRDRTEAPASTIAACTVCYVLGVATMLGSDVQKYVALKAKPGLITTGFFARVRHPNYLGEMMIYGSFAALAGHRAPWAVLAVVWSSLFLPNILRKEARMSRYAEWKDYARRSWMLLPRILI